MGNEKMLDGGVLEGTNPVIGGVSVQTDSFIPDKKPNKIYKTLVETQVLVPFKRLHDDAVLPTYAKDGDAGMDCTAVSDPIVTDKFIAYDLGFAVAIPKGYVGYLFPRSSISKTSLVLANSVGVIDSGYRGPVQARFKLIKGDLIYSKGDKVCQLIVMPLPTVLPQWVEELDETERGDGGFGSTDVKENN